MLMIWEIFGFVINVGIELVFSLIVLKSKMLWGGTVPVEAI
jgi:hypothetical protein